MHEAFLEAVLESPEDDAPRLVYADWCEDHGDPDRAELIRLQIRHETTCPYSFEWDEEKSRIRHLLQRNQPRWTAGLPVWAARSAEFRRGFPAVVHANVDAFLADADDLARRMPLDGVHVNFSASGDMARLAPVLGLAREWRFLYQEELSDEVTQALVDSPHLGRVRGLAFAGGFANIARLALADLPALRSLGLPHHDIDAEALAALAEAPFFRRLTNLDLSDGTVGAEGVSALGAGSNLERLLLDGAELGDEGARRLARVPFARLRELSVPSNDITADGLAALAASPHLSSLTFLNACRNPLGPTAGETLAVATFRLECLDLRDVGFHDEGAARFVASDRASRLRRLDIGENRLTATGVVALSESPHLANLWQLDVDMNSIGADGALALLSSPSLPSLRELNVHTARLSMPTTRAWPVRGAAKLKRLWAAWNGIDGPTAEALFTRLESSALEDLDISHNPLGAEGARAIAAPGLSRLRSLRAYQTGIGSSGAKALAASATLTSLESLTLSTCGLDDDAVEALAAWPLLSRVTGLMLDGNAIGPRGAAALAAAPRLGLRELDLSNNPIGDDGVEALARAPWPAGLEYLALRHCRLGARAALALLGIEPHALSQCRYLDLRDNSPEFAALAPELAARFGPCVRWK